MYHMLILKFLSMLLHVHQIPNDYNIGIYLGDDGTHSNHRAIYLWLEKLLEKDPNIDFEEVNRTFRACLPEYLFN